MENTVVLDVIEKIRECDDFHNKCDYLLEHDECTYLIEYIKELEEKAWKYDDLNK